MKQWLLKSSWSVKVSVSGRQTILMLFFFFTGSNSRNSAISLINELLLNYILASWEWQITATIYSAIGCASQLLYLLLDGQRWTGHRILRALLAHSAKKHRVHQLALLTLKRLCCNDIQKGGARNWGVKWVDSHCHTFLQSSLVFVSLCVTGDSLFLFTRFSPQKQAQSVLVMA